MATEPKTAKVKNVSPLGEVRSYLARRVFKAGEVIELPADIAGTEPSVRDYVEGEDVPAGHLLVDPDGTKHVIVPGVGLLGQPENFVRVEDEPAPALSKSKAPHGLT